MPTTYDLIKLINRAPDFVTLKRQIATIVSNQQLIDEINANSDPAQAMIIREKQEEIDVVLNNLSRETIDFQLP